MRTRSIFAVPFLALLLLGAPPIYAQRDSVLTLVGAIRTAQANYRLLQARNAYALASKEDISTARGYALPEVYTTAEQAMGTQNGMNGLPTAMPGITAMTSGPATPQQNWNAAFGALYISNVDLNLYQFGAQRARVAAANAQYEQDSRQLDQEVFQVQARVATAYLNTLVAVQLRQVAQRNLDRTVELQKTIEARTLNGLNPGVDSSLADAEVSRARLALLDAIDVETVQGRQLSIAMGVDVHTPTLDSSMVRRPPQGLFPSTDTVPDSHPVLQFLQSRVTTSEYNTRFIWRAAMPRVGFFGVLQERGSGYGTYYGNNFKDYTTSYWTGVSPARANYMFGIGISWDLTQAYRTRSQMKAAQFRTTGLRQEMLLEKNLLSNQASLANDELRTAIDKYNEAPIQLNAASSAYDQKSALYENGLTTIVDLTQALYLLNKAEIDKEVARDAIWQVYLQKVIATGDLSPFLQQL